MEGKDLKASTLRTGVVWLPLAGWRLLSANDIPNSGAADGGTISKNTDPILERVNGATDKALRLNWAAASVVEIAQSFIYPPDWDGTQPVTVNLLYYKSANVNTTMVCAVGYWEGKGGSDFGGNTAALTGTTLTKVAVTITAANVGEYPNCAQINLIPGAHASDALYVVGAWVEYVRK